MTTIAYRDGVMAADSKMTCGDDFVSRCNKVFRLKYGHLLGQSGDADERDLLALFNTVRSDKALPSRAQLAELKMAFNCLLVLRNGRVFYCSCTFQEDAADADLAYQAQVIECPEKFAAVGNGFRYAIGAMAAGATAKRAVEIACRYDIVTGPPVRVFPLKEK